MPYQELNLDLLVRHPAPFPTESLLGYILRLTQENGYRTPWSVLRLAGISQHEFERPGLKVAKLAKVVGRSTAELDRLAYSPPEGRPRAARLLGHSLLPRDLILDRPRLCSQCVAEKGFLEAHWDLEFMTACPIHQTRLLSNCPQCGARLNWYRPGLLECRCGATLQSVDLPGISQQEASLLDLVRRKVLGRELSADKSSSLPAVHLYAMALRPLLALIWTLGKHRLIVLGESSYAPSDITSAAGDVLSDWPNNFFDLLGAIGEKRPKSNRKGGVRGQFESIYSALFTNAAIKPPQCTDFLKAAFLDFAKNHWDQGYVDPNMMKKLSPGVKGKFLTQLQFAKEFGMSVGAAARLVRENKVAVRRIRCGSQERILIDPNQPGIPRNYKGRIYRLKKAAALIGLPRRVLYGLKRGGQFEAKHSGVRAGYHELDLRAFEQKLLALAPSSNGQVSADRYITLGKIFGGHHGAPSGRINIIRAMLSRELTVIGNVNGKIGGLAIPLQEYKTFAQNDRARANGNARTPSEVAAELHCDREAVPGLFKRGLLKGKQIPVGLRMTERSIAAFKERYVSLASIAAELGSSSRALMRYCVANKISLLNVQSTRLGQTQPFVRIGDKEELLRFRAQRSLQKTVILVGLPIGPS